MHSDVALTIARAGNLGANSFDDLVSLILRDLDELVVKVAALSGNKRRAVLPLEIPGKRFIRPTAVLGIGTPEYSCRSLAAAEVVHDGVVRDLICHFCLYG